MTLSFPPRGEADADIEDEYTPAEHTQLAALCYREGDNGREILMVTSSRGRWILPKGWPMKGKKNREAALIEAWEEGGVKKGKVSRKPMGKYMATKLTKSGDEEVTETAVYEVKVKDIRKKFPERDRRERRWVSPKKAAKLVTEDGLRQILKSFGKA